MPTKNAIIRQFSRLEGAGLKPPYTDAFGCSAAGDVWLDLLEELTDAQLEAAVKEHARRSRWWPTPGELLALVPPEQPTERSRPELVRQAEPWPGQRVGRLDGRRQTNVLDEAQEQARSAWLEAGVKPCGAAPGRHTCPLDCEPCGRDVLERADQLADRAHLRLVEGL